MHIQDHTVPPIARIIHAADEQALFFPRRPIHVEDRIEPTEFGEPILGVDSNGWTCGISTDTGKTLTLLGRDRVQLPALRHEIRRLAEDTGSDLDDLLEYVDRLQGITRAVFPELGDTIRGMDFESRDDCLVEGVVHAIGMVNGVAMYVLRGTGDWWCGKINSRNLVGQELHVPVGAQMDWTGRVQVRRDGQWVPALVGMDALQAFQRLDTQDADDEN